MNKEEEDVVAEGYDCDLNSPKRGCASQYCTHVDFPVVVAF